MRAVVQRVSRASVSVDGQTVGQIEGGLCVFVGVETGDSEQDARYIAEKVHRLRVFPDTASKMNLSLGDAGGAALVISQFTLLGDARGQNRPGFTRAEEPERANALYLQCCGRLRELGARVEMGVFRAHMAVSLTNDGPVTILLDSRKQF